MPNIQLFDPLGNRKYLTSTERQRFEAAAMRAEGLTGTFCLMLLNTGCRISEAVNLRVRHIDFESKGAIFETLKQRQKGIYRFVPLPENFLNMLNMVHDLRRRTQGKDKDQFIWTSQWLEHRKQWTRKTAYSKVMDVMEAAALSGLYATPKGLRHGFAITCLDKGVPLNMVQKWMGHSSVTTTAIYANAIGEEERAIASRLWASA
jgi:integrase/recombinase XerD